MALLKCGLYRTIRPVAGIAEGRLVYFHNHGDPGPGLYLPVRWSLNRAEFSERGQTLADVDEDQRGLLALPAEGLYRVEMPFACCEKRCRTFAQDTLVQLGYNGAGQAIVFEPEWAPSGLSFPTTGQLVDDRCLLSLVALKVGAQADAPPEHFH